MVYEFTKIVTNAPKLHDLLDENFISFTHITFTKPDALKVYFDEALSEPDQTLLNDLIFSFENYSTAESLAEYLDGEVFPFVKKLLTTFAAENIAMGITQAGKTADTLGLFQKSFDIGASHPVSLKAALDTGSLYVAISIIQHVRDNPLEFTGLSPFITDTRLKNMKNEIELFLGLELSN